MAPKLFDHSSLPGLRDPSFPVRSFDFDISASMLFQYSVDDYFYLMFYFNTLARNGGSHCRSFI